ncbi:hypothetical protein B0H13DRAFT_491393 [Mycena leptocephala]|nr:hypothetical protein B0H13DRAFT_491393 [Mycena leptocephala]
MNLPWMRQGLGDTTTKTTPRSFTRKPNPPLPGFASEWFLTRGGHPPQKSNRYRAFARLVEDAKFHSTYLAYAEGLMVPIHYGMWVTDTGDWAGTVLFSLSQWCGMSWNELSYTRMNTEANRILVGSTLEALHDHGVHRGGLGNFDNFRHVIIDVHVPGLSQEDLLNGKAPCYVVGFSEAYATHYCTRKLPILPLGSYIPLEEVGCDEIASALILLGFMKKSDTATPVSKALEWHDKYSELHPDVDNMDVAIAQRARLYSDHPPVYPDLDVSFESDEEYAKAIIWRTLPDTEEEETELATDDGPDSSADPGSPRPILELLDEADSLENASDNGRAT